MFPYLGYFNLDILKELTLENYLKGIEFLHNEYYFLLKENSDFLEDKKKANPYCSSNPYCNYLLADLLNDKEKMIALNQENLKNEKNEMKIPENITDKERVRIEAQKIIFDLENKKIQDKNISKEISKLYSPFFYDSHKKMNYNKVFKNYKNQIFKTTEDFNILLRYDFFYELIKKIDYKDIQVHNDFFDLLITMIKKNPQKNIELLDSYFYKLKEQVIQFKEHKNIEMKFEKMFEVYQKLLTRFEPIESSKMNLGGYILNEVDVYFDLLFQPLYYFEATSKNLEIIKLRKNNLKKDFLNNFYFYLGKNIFKMYEIDEKIVEDSEFKSLFNKDSFYSGLVKSNFGYERLEKVNMFLESLGGKEFLIRGLNDDKINFSVKSDLILFLEQLLATEENIDLDLNKINLNNDMYLLFSRRIWVNNKIQNETKIDAYSKIVFEKENLKNFYNKENFYYLLILIEEDKLHEKYIREIFDYIIKYLNMEDIRSFGIKEFQNIFSNLKGPQNKAKLFYIQYSSTMIYTRNESLFFLTKEDDKELENLNFEFLNNTDEDINFNAKKTLEKILEDGIIKKERLKDTLNWEN